MIEKTLSLPGMVSLSMRSKILFWGMLFIAGFLLCSGCASNYYVTAYNLQQRGRYIGAIENYDFFIARSRDGAMITKALNNRALAYYQLGLQAQERQNYRLAIRFLYLANNEEADERIIECYLAILDDTEIRDDPQEAMELCNFIIDAYIHIPSVSEVIYRRLMIIHEYLDDIQAILRDYELLVEHDAENVFLSHATEILDHHMPIYIEQAKSYPDDEAIDRLLNILDYTSTYQDVINKEIGELYFKLADQYRSEENFQVATEYYSLAVEYSPEIQKEISQRLDKTVIQMIAMGDELLNQRKIEEAIVAYNDTFKIIPDNQAAQRAIEQAKLYRQNIDRALDLFNQALQLEKQERYQEARRLYRESYSFDNLPRTAEKISLMSNLLEIERDPEDFARKIITEYKGGLIVKNLNNIARRIEQELDDDEVNVSGWRVMLSTGTHRYEIRYDITSRLKNHYFIWQVNLLNRQLTPLNEISSNVMGS